MEQSRRSLAATVAALLLVVHSACGAEPASERTSEAWRLTSSMWERPAPQGWYVLRISTGDGAKVRDLAGLEVEGTPLLDGASAMNRLASSITVLRQVSDGHLTLGNAAAHAGRIGSIEVAEAYPPDRVIAWNLIGWSSPKPTDRCVGMDLKRTGWRGFVRHVIEPQIRWGARRIALSNPFGCLPGEDMQFDQYLHAKDQKLAWLTNEFAQAWLPVTESGVEVVCYLGKLKDDPSFPLLSTDRAGWERRFWESVQPALDAKMTVALDASAGDHAEAYHAADLLEAKGVKVYVEPRPNVNAPRWLSYPFFTVDTFWERSNPARHPDSAWGARDERLTGEIIRIITEPPRGATWKARGWLEPYARRIMADNHTVAVPLGNLMTEVSFPQLLRFQGKAHPAQTTESVRKAQFPQ